MKILVTAFKPFAGRPTNASSLALGALKNDFTHIHVRTLPVDSVAAPSLLKQAIRKTLPDALIMLGEAAGSQEIRLETIAWNVLDFQIPDSAGRQPTRTEIIRSAPSQFRSTLPISKIHATLAAAGHDTVISVDAGRYLCNQLFYIARHHLETQKIPCLAGFIHLPLAQDYPTARATAAIKCMIDVLIHTPKRTSPQMIENC